MTGVPVFGEPATATAPHPDATPMTVGPQRGVVLTNACNIFRKSQLFYITLFNNLLAPIHQIEKISEFNSGRTS
jgi:hypothetical protein